MPKIKSSELILNPDGSIYHLGLHPDQIAETIITVGDPARVERVSRHFDQIEIKQIKREFITHTGFLNGTRLTVISTGVGTDNLDIVINELDALVNIDLEERVIKDDLTSLNLIRVGTSGGMRKDIAVDSIISSAYAIGLDGLMHAYGYSDKSGLNDAFLQHCETRTRLYLKPYSAPANAFISEAGWSKGITLTCPGFYGPQFRTLRMSPGTDNYFSAVEDFKFDQLHLTNLEMESSALFAMAQMLGHNAMSVSAILANRATGEFSKDTKAPVDQLIVQVLERLTT